MSLEGAGRRDLVSGRNGRSRIEVVLNISEGLVKGFVDLGLGNGSLLLRLVNNHGRPVASPRATSNLGLQVVVIIGG
jgi:hypothetical protein